jgi:hypothetical protein
MNIVGKKVTFYLEFQIIKMPKDFKELSACSSRMDKVTCTVIYGSFKLTLKHPNEQIVRTAGNYFLEEEINQNESLYNQQIGIDPYICDWLAFI